MAKTKVFFEHFDKVYYFYGSSHNWQMTNMHYHNQYEIILFLNDGATLEVDNRLYKVAEGDLFLVHPSQFHRTIGGEQNYTRYILQFEPSLISDLSTALNFNFTHFFNEDRPRLPLAKGNLKIIENHLIEVGKYVSTQDNPLLLIKLKLSIVRLLLAINDIYEVYSRQENGLTSSKQFETVFYNEKISQIKHYIDANIESNLEVQALAQQFNLSRCHLSHLFTKTTGFSLKQYIVNKKILLAKELLDKNHPVWEVAEMLKYHSPSHFITLFKSQCGITPKQYIKQKNSTIL